MSRPDYESIQTRPAPDGLTVPELYTRMTSRTPGWINLAMRVRDRIGRLFGLRTIDDFSAPTAMQEGSTVHFWQIEELGDDRMQVFAEDHHLIVRAVLERTEDQFRLTTRVHIHNWVGRLYMLPVGIAHPVICNTMLNRALTPP